MSVVPVPRRLLMTTDTVGGVFDYATELARMLNRSGVEVILATMGEPLTAAQAETLRAIDRLRVFESRFKLEWMDDPWRDVDEAGQWLLDIEHRTRPDLVHLNGYMHGALRWNAPVVVVGHSCVLSWWRAVLGEPPPSRLQEYARRVRRGLRQADLVVAPSAAMLESLRDIYGPFEHGQVIYNARDGRDFRPLTKEPFLFTMGRLWDQAKNMRLVDDAAATLDWPVLMAGRLEQVGASARDAASRPRHAHALGHLEANVVKDMLGRASIYVHPARYEPFGLAILEAAMAGCALVLGDIASLREIWHDAAIFVPVGAANRLAAVLSALIRDSEKRLALAALARRRARRFTPYRMLSEYLAAYRRALGASTSYRDKEKSVCA